MRLFIACKIIPKITKVRHNIQNSKLFKNQNKEAAAVELENMLNINPEAVHNSLSINEPTFVREYAPLPLQAPYSNKNAIQKYIPEPSAPHSSNTNILNKITPSHQGKSDPRKCLGPHTICSYVVGQGMVWEDLCRCDENDKTA